MEARLYNKADKNYVHCFLCAHHCKIADGKRGICGVRENRGGILYTLVPLFIIRRICAEKTWMRFFKADKLVEQVTKK